MWWVEDSEGNKVYEGEFTKLSDEEGKVQFEIPVPPEEGEYTFNAKTTAPVVSDILSKTFRVVVSELARIAHFFFGGLWSVSRKITGQMRWLLLLILIILAVAYALGRKYDKTREATRGAFLIVVTLAAVKLLVEHPQILLALQLDRIAHFIFNVPLEVRVVVLLAVFFIGVYWIKRR